MARKEHVHVAAFGAMQSECIHSRPWLPNVSPSRSVTGNLPKSIESLDVQIEFLQHAAANSVRLVHLSMSRAGLGSLGQKRIAREGPSAVLFETKSVDYASHM